ncbi:hypothetical protein, partial [Streptomyces canus]|uniref:hypothetical protein n=1 Tax=Streptomyces canus TaxID=58343 RepID=UPI00371193B6
GGCPSSVRRLLLPRLYSGNGRRPLRADTPHPVPFPPYAANGPSWRAVRRTARRGAGGLSV